MTHYFEVKVKLPNGKTRREQRIVRDMQVEEGESAVDAAREQWKKYFPREEYESIEEVGPMAPPQSMATGQLTA